MNPDSRATLKLVGLDCPGKGLLEPPSDLGPIVGHRDGVVTFRRETGEVIAVVDVQVDIYENGWVGVDTERASRGLDLKVPYSVQTDFGFEPPHIMPVFGEST